MIEAKELPTPSEISTYTDKQKLEVLAEVKNVKKEFLKGIGKIVVACNKTIKEETNKGYKL